VGVLGAVAACVTFEECCSLGGRAIEEGLDAGVDI
jgi:hypothetical protein